MRPLSLFLAEQVFYFLTSMVIKWPRQGTRNRIVILRWKYIPALTKLRERNSAMIKKKKKIEKTSRSRCTSRYFNVVASPFFSLYKLNGAIVARRVKRANPIFRRGFRASNLDGDIAHVRNYLSSYTGCQLFLFSCILRDGCSKCSRRAEREREREVL